MYFRSLQVYRAFAALGVVFYHLQCFLESIGGAANTPFRVFGLPFSRGCWFFFVLSGFLMAQQVDAGSGSGWFLGRRLVRIYPSYWLAVAGVILLRVLAFGAVSMAGLLGGMTLLPMQGLPSIERYPLGIEWTLIFEVFFYAVCAVFANRWLRSYFGIFLVAWMVAVVARWAPAAMLPSASHLPLSPYNLLFATGGLTYYLWRAYAARPRVLVTAGISAGVVGFSAAWPLYDLPLVGFAGVGFAGLILVGMAWDQRRGYAAGRTGFLERLGDRSYGLYLVHAPIIITVLIEARYVLGWKTTTPVGLLALTLALAIGWCYGSLDLIIYRHCKRFVSGVRLRRASSGPAQAAEGLRGTHIRGTTSRRTTVPD